MSSISSGSDAPMLDAKIDNRTLAEIFRDLPSPKASAKYPVNCTQGMRTSLYPYQRETVSAMLAREAESPATINDPLFIPMKGMDGTSFYLQPSTMESRQECPQVAQSRGGILCEELGTGKTVIVLSLIVATLDQLPETKTSVPNICPPLTPLAFRHFPNVEFAAAREHFARGCSTRVRLEQQEPRQIASLVETLLHYCKVHPENLDIRSHIESLKRRLREPLRLNVAYYYESMPELVRTRRNYTDPGPRKMYLSPATLVVVPVNLFLQWRNEIMKHCHDTLRVLEVKTDTVLPGAVDLASNYDCKVPSATVTPLLQVRWKRLVIDEGHVSASIVTNLTPFAKILSVERKWIVTGTPTTNLLGLQFGGGSELQYPESPVAEGSPAADAIEPNLVVRTWTRDDREDLRKLSNMIVHFLEVPQFAAGAKTLFNKAIIQPLMANPRPRPGAIEVLEQVMSSVMIRHRIIDVEEDVLLPLLHQKTILLDLDQYAIKSYNALQAGIVINAVDSERTGQDYLFHPSLRVMFWHVDDEKCYNVNEIANGSKEFLQNARHRNISEEDLILLQQAISCVYSAVHDPTWRAMQNHVSVFHRVHNILSNVYEAWSSLPARVTRRYRRVLRSDQVLSSERLTKLRSFVTRQPLADMTRIVLAVRDVMDEEEARLHSEQELIQRKTKKRKQTNKHRKEQEVAQHAVAPEKRDEVQREFVAGQKWLLALFQNEMPGRAAGVHRQPSITSRLLSLSPLAGVRIGKSTSSKLDFILNEVLQHSPTEKFLIFSNSPLTLKFVAEGLELVQIKHIRFTTMDKPKLREQFVTTFETSALYRVFLMELKHGARGLYGPAFMNLISASRVIFCEPVWQADVEIQAIK
ncbi:hypothetical protein IEO21_03163 [Rhodonia placenta]|uniref:Helicase ATP-binding domain-containing protein n=1 Tax=Rhodonia placenta TaxID=104341 RepID=A0A8H7P6K3_9APHY|nr:hypothetical protein IEO21_03163 [Postia placenta]